jgi:hypothetical protein
VTALPDIPPADPIDIGYLGVDFEHSYLVPAAGLTPEESTVKAAFYALALQKSLEDIDAELKPGVPAALHPTVDLVKAFLLARSARYLKSWHQAD